MTSNWISLGGILNLLYMALLAVWPQLACQAHCPPLLINSTWCSLGAWWSGFTVVCLLEIVSVIQQGDRHRQHFSEEELEGQNGQAAGPSSHGGKGEWSWDSSPGLSGAGAYSLSTVPALAPGLLPTMDPHISVVLCMKLSWPEMSLSWFLQGSHLTPQAEGFSHTPALIISSVYCLIGQCFVAFTTRASAPRAEEPHVLSIFYRTTEPVLQPIVCPPWVLNKCLYNTRKWINIRWTATGQWEGFKSFFRVFSLQALC